MYRSQYPLPPLPETNYHNYAWRGPETMPDYVMQIDAVTGQKRTRSEFIERMYDGATALGSSKQAGGLGLTPNDIVGILSDNCLEYIVLAHSLLVITTPFALFSTYATLREMAHNLATSKATHIFVHASLLPRFLPVAIKARFPEDRIYVLEGKPIIGAHLQSFGQMIEKVRRERIPRVPIREAQRDTLAYLVFSSGTSGLPKAVMVSHGNIIASTAQGKILFAEFAKHMPAPDPNVQQVVLSCLPFFHTSSLHSSILRAPTVRSTYVVMPRWDLNMALRAISRYRVTQLSLIPSIVHKFVHSPQFAKLDLSAISTIVCGAAYLPPTLGDKFKSIVSPNLPLIDGYGMSEGTLRVLFYLVPSISTQKADPGQLKIGGLVPGLEAMILREDGTHCLPGEAGELYIKGPNIALGYWNNPGATKETFLADGWLRTGDNFKIDANGLYCFEDRGKDTLKVSGMQVSPVEIEDVLLSEPKGLITDAAVTGVQLPHARTSDDRAPRAWVVLSARGRGMREEEVRSVLTDWVRLNLSKYKWLRGGIEFIDEIPKNPTGKVLRRTLRDRYDASHLSRSKL